MKRMKIGVLLLALLLATMAMVPMVSAGEEVGNSVDSTDLETDSIVHHHITSDYLKDAKPAQWRSEEEMINIIISQKTLGQFGQSTKSGLINLFFKTDISKSI